MRATAPSRRTSMWSGRATGRSFGSIRLRLQQSGGFARAEINRISALVEENRDTLLQAWNEFFSD
jgi:hypothetical protein